jgi:hypothetical protein
MADQNCPKTIKGSSGCSCPNPIKNKKEAKNKDHKNLKKGLYELPLFLDTSTKGKAKSTNKEANIATTPNNLLGILLKIA